MRENWGATIAGALLHVFVDHGGEKFSLIVNLRASKNHGGAKFSPTAFCLRAM